MENFSNIIFFLPLARLEGWTNTTTRVKSPHVDSLKNLLSESEEFVGKSNEQHTVGLSLWNSWNCLGKKEKRVHVRQNKKRTPKWEFYEISSSIKQQHWENAGENELDAWSESPNETFDLTWETFAVLKSRFSLSLCWMEIEDSLNLHFDFRPNKKKNSTRTTSSMK